LKSLKNKDAEYFVIYSKEIIK